ncbi:DUF5663 domain-containing protein [Gordonia aquimaris]|uniref:DUF5663 domain-containing protein n=1 Tax=Gordonia aquimaris TaxID=2984863 RepID=A0A9X3D8R6_9ACTN|nr:DUF5663 domain-containing protein [Gordonia aquimaris]MCX2966846.1 DUF5663 domain-containing protein [Gordonia aquimaris]
MTSTNNPDPVMYCAIRMFLPGLADDDAADLTQRAFAQVEKRVGSRLASGLSDAQLEEFEKLIDAGHDDECAHWLEREVPDYPRVVVEERTTVIAEVVRVVSVDLAAVRGSRLFDEIKRTDLHDLRELFADNDSDDPAQGDDDAVLVRVQPDGPVAVWTEADSGPRRFIVRCEIQTLIGDAAMAEAEQFCNLWNSSCPIVSLRLRLEGEHPTLAAEGGIPLGAGMSQPQLAYHVDLAHRAIAETVSELTQMAAADSATG